MDEVLSPLAKLDLDDFNSDSTNTSYPKYDFIDEINGNVEESDINDEYQLQNGNLQSSLENLVNNFDSIVADCFNDGDEKLDSINEDYQDTLNNNSQELLDKNKIWLTLTSSLDKSLNLNWKTFKTYEQFKNAVSIHQEDVVKQNLDLPDDEELAIALDHNSRPIGCLPCDFEPIQTADEIINEIDNIMGNTRSSVTTLNRHTDSIDNYTDCYFTSSLHQSDFIGSQEAINASRTLLDRPHNWIEELENKPLSDLNRQIEHLEDTIRDYNSLLLQNLSEREDLLLEKQERDQFVELIHQIDNRNQISTHSDQTAQKPHNRSMPDDCYSNTAPVKRASSWKSIFMSPFKYAKSTIQSTKNNDNSDVISNSSDDINVSISHRHHSDVSIPVYEGYCEDRHILRQLNEILYALLYSSPDHFNQLLTDFILNVYAPSQTFNQPLSLDLSL